MRVGWVGSKEKKMGKKKLKIAPDGNSAVGVCLIHRHWLLPGPTSCRRQSCPPLASHNEFNGNLKAIISSSSFFSKRLSTRRMMKTFFRTLALEANHSLRNTIIFELDTDEETVIMIEFTEVILFRSFYT